MVGAGVVVPVGEDGVKVEARGPSVFCVGPDCAVPPQRAAVPMTARTHFAEHFAEDFAHALEEARHDDAVPAKG